MSIARQHIEWLSLVEASGPFLSLPVLLRVFPTGLDVEHEPPLARTLRQVYEEWLDSQGGPRPDSAIHTQWLRWALKNLLDFPDAALLSGPALPPALSVALPEQGETLRPDYALQHPAGGPPRLLIQLYPATQKLEKPVAGRLWPASPAERMMQLLRRAGVRLGLVTNGEHWLLVHALPANRDEPASYISFYASAWLEEPLTLRAFRSLLRAARFFSEAETDTLEALFLESGSNQQEVTDQLGYQVRRAVETLVQALDRLDKDRQRRLLAGISEGELYQAALTVMMRLVFLMSAEERGLLPLGENELYDRYYAVSTVGAQLREMADRHSEQILETRSDAYNRLLATFRMVHGGVDNAELPLPAYGGELFDPDRYPFLEGRGPGSHWQSDPAQPLPINNRVVLHLLDALQWLQVRIPGGGGSERRKLSFRALDIEQIGHVYEGLLDHTARRASGPVLSLKGSQYNEPEVELATLEAARAKGEKPLLDFLREATGRSESTLKKDLQFQPDLLTQGRLRAACDNEAALYERVRPFAGLVRLDSFDNYVVITPGSVYVTEGSDRRSTGTHYTPRSLTEPIVQHTLDPLVYVGPAEGWPEEAWQLRPAAELLSLRICDMAMGSGAFLVQACRYLAEKLTRAWEAEGRVNQTARPPAEDSAGLPHDTIPAEPQERLTFARRLIAENCLYGVDKNPMAVEMAKLSLWLITMNKNQPFNFLSHHLRGGDSLLGVTRRQLVHRSLDPRAAERPDLWQYNRLMERTIAEALTIRRRIGALPVNADARIYEQKARLQREFEELTALLRLGGDITVAIGLEANRERKGLLDTTLELPYTVLVRAYEEARQPNQPLTAAGQAELETARAELQAKVDSLLADRDRRPFHWPVEFPEVFYPDALYTAYRQLPAGPAPAALPPLSVEPGFHALVGNPPFQGGQKITGALGTDYRDYLVEHLAGGKRGSADLCAYFFLRADELANDVTMAGFLATNTIAQGDTREVGLEQLVAKGWSIPRAIPSRRWPGAASLEVAHIWLDRHQWQAAYSLDEKPVAGITPFLTTPGAVQGNPYPLLANAGKSFIGSYVLGMGFVLEPSEAQALIDKDPRNRDVLSLYLNGEDLNTNPDQSPSRWVINFHDWPLSREASGSWSRANEKERLVWLRKGIVPKDYPDPVAADYLDCLRIIEQKVKPERQKINDKIGKEIWWRFLRTRPELRSAIAGMERVLVVTIVTQHFVPAFCPIEWVYAHRCCIFPLEDWISYCIIQSNIHEKWTRQYSSSLETRLNYSPSDCFETFPFPEGVLEGRAGPIENPKLDRLEEIGELYYNHRQAIMNARQEGLTKTYNRFHNPAESSADIARLRELHREMDEAVAAAYGWPDLDLGHAFHETKQGLRYTISEAARREVLGRLLTLNHARHAAEVAAGLHDKGKKVKGSGARGQGAGSSIENRLSPNGGKSKIENSPSHEGQARLFEVAPAGSLWEWAEQQPAAAEEGKAEK